MADIVIGAGQETGSVTEENVNEAMASLLQQGGFGVEGFQEQAPAAPAETPPAESQQEELPEPPAPQPPVDAPAEEAPFLTLPDGRVLTLEDAERFAQFEQTVMSDPRFLAAYEQVYGEEQETPPVAPVAPADAPAAPHKFELPDDMALELEVNPVAKLLWNQLQQQDTRFQESLTAVQAEAQRASALATTQQEAMETYQRNNAATLVNQAKANFQREHNLKPDEMERVFNTTVNLFNLDRIVSLPFDPRTGKMETPDPVRRLEGAFDAAYKAIPEFFEREQETRIAAARTEAERKAKITSLSSSGSSAPPPAPVDNANPATRRDALIADVAASMSGNYIQPE